MIDEQGFVAVEDGLRIWTHRLGGGGDDERAPLLILHGPGFPHDYLQNLAALASPRQPVVFYDQLGCGRSDCPDDPGRWRLPRFVTEIDHVRRALRLDRVVLLGQSWGGMLAIEYALTQPDGLVGLVLANSTASAPLWGAEAQRLRADLPPHVQAALARHETAGTTDSPEYKACHGRVLRPPRHPRAAHARLRAPQLRPYWPALRRDVGPQRISHHRQSHGLGPNFSPGRDWRADVADFGRTRRIHPRHQPGVCSAASLAHDGS